MLHHCRWCVAGFVKSNKFVFVDYWSQELGEDPQAKRRALYAVQLPKQQGDYTSTWDDVWREVGEVEAREYR